VLIDDDVDIGCSYVVDLDISHHTELMKARKARTRATTDGLD
jgi:hypothetical protein